MTDDTDSLFEQRLRSLLSRAGDVKGMALTAERLKRLRALVPSASVERPSLTLVWKRMAEGITETLSILKTSGLLAINSPAPLLRDGTDAAARLDMISFPLQGGELRAQVIPGENRKARILLSVKGAVAERDDLSVELSFGQRLIEARPLEQKAEVSINGTGSFAITVFAGETPLGTMHLGIGAAEDSGNA